MLESVRNNHFKLFLSLSLTLNPCSLCSILYRTRNNLQSGGTTDRNSTLSASNVNEQLINYHSSVFKLVEKKQSIDRLNWQINCIHLPNWRLFLVLHLFDITVFHSWKKDVPIGGGECDIFVNSQDSSTRHLWFAIIRDCLKGSHLCLGRVWNSCDCLIDYQRSQENKTWSKYHQLTAVSWSNVTENTIRMRPGCSIRNQLFCKKSIRGRMTKEGASQTESIMGDRR